MGSSHREISNSVSKKMLEQDYRQLELNIISAQDLKEMNVGFGKVMKTYAVAWLHMNSCKLSTQIDRTGGANPTWNDKVIFRVEEDFLRCERSTLMMEIYCVGHFKDAMVGSARVMISNLVKGYGSKEFHEMNFSALQVRRPSGRPQGILNIGTVVLDGDLHRISAPGRSKAGIGAVGYRDLMGKSLKPKLSVTEKVLFMKWKADRDSNVFQYIYKSPDRQVKKIRCGKECSNAALTYEKEEGKTEGNKNYNQMDAEKISKSVGCYHVPFVSKFMRNTVGLRNGPAKIHLSPSDSNFCAKNKNPSV